MPMPMVTIINNNTKTKHAKNLSIRSDSHRPVLSNWQPFYQQKRIIEFSYV